MELLRADVQAVPDVIDMLHVHNPDPRAPPFMAVPVEPSHWASFQFS